MADHLPNRLEVRSAALETTSRKQLNFEEAEGDYRRTVYLYERCLTTAALYEEFWQRYARWMMAQAGKEEVRIIYQRSSCVYFPILRLSVRHNYALLEETCGRLDVSKVIYEAILAASSGERGDRNTEQR
ncbi:hypothetical protein BDY21DRAFT_371175 [Lineolata rhizophorae]|uniref:Suppressor of forked domain-containing protein n=1 Tax=Lineolata rhizophorae TaxID=578093 RepID=A0A6A6P3G6_9PEZI|nr:hypothetical protein BDY21DRAFT_371175 [Lineolata rhizophorae]